MIGFLPQHTKREPFYDAKGNRLGSIEGRKLYSSDGRLIAIVKQFKQSDANASAVGGQRTACQHWPMIADWWVR